jgi:hypothetical protein
VPGLNFFGPPPKSEIGSFEANNHLPKLLERVQKAERFIITKHGHRKLNAADKQAEMDLFRS